MWSKLGTRLLSALIGVIFVLGFIFSSPKIFNLAISTVSLVILYELNTAFNKEKKWQLLLLDYVFAVVILITLFIDVKLLESGDFTFLMIIYIILLSVSAVIWNEKIKFYDIITSFFSIIYSVIFMYHLAMVREMENGVVLVFLPMLGAWMPDTFAYFSGILFGKHKLIPKISPNKTVEGAVGGIVGCLIMFYVFAAIVSSLGFGVRYIPLTALALICGVLAQFGDLTASLIKRECHAKDFGNLMPGHGGILDRVDSLLFVAPVVYYYLLTFEVIFI